jgi:hypothetical protein
MLFLTFIATLVACGSLISGFVPRRPIHHPRNTAAVVLPSSAMADYLVEPTQRDAHYQGNVAQYLLDLDEAKATFDFCGGLMFQLELTDKLKEHLHNTQQQPVIFDSSKFRMHNVPDYEQSAFADNVHIFHGREIRKAPHASGGMGLVLQLSLAGGDDPEGWTSQEVAGYDGWGHDGGRVWRTGDRLVKEGFATFQQKYGPKAFSLNHRFYFHYDSSGKMWLSAEDGCEGTPAKPFRLASFFDRFGR